MPDFGNFHIQGDEWYDRYQGVAELMPFAKAVSAKSHDFDAEGNERHTDYRRMLRIVLNAGYRGHLGIEYEGDELPEPEGIRKTKALLERVRAGQPVLEPGDSAPPYWLRVRHSDATFRGAGPALRAATRPGQGWHGHRLPRPRPQT